MIFGIVNWCRVREQGPTNYICGLFATLALFASAGLSAADPPSSGLVPPGEFVFGVNGHPLGGSGIYSEANGVNLAEQMALLNELGAKWYRGDVFARDFDPLNGWFGSDELDLIVPAAQQAGIEFHPMLNPPIELRPYENLLQTKTLSQIYTIAYNHAKAAATKWQGQIKLWDLTNEPDGWTINTAGGVPNGDQMSHYDPTKISIAAAIIKGQSDGIRDGDPQAKVSLNNGGWLHTGFVDHMVANGVQFDVLSWHWYDEMGRIDRMAGAGNFDLLAKLQTYGKPIWIGEANFRDPAGVEDPADEAWLMEFMRSMHGYRDRGVEAFFQYQLIDEVPLGGDNAHYGLVEAVPAPGGGWDPGDKKSVFYKYKNLVANAVNVRSDGSIFNDDFAGTSLDESKWTSNLSGVALNVANGRLQWNSNSAAEGSIRTISEIDLEPTDVWAAEMRFRVNTSVVNISTGLPNGSSSNAPRQFDLLTGTGDGATVEEFAVSVLRHPINSQLFSLGWSNWRGPTDTTLADASGFATDLARGVYYTLFLHHRANGEMDLYLDGVYLTTRSGFNGSVSSMLFGDLSSTIGGNIDVEFIRLGLPLGLALTGDYNSDGTVDAIDYTVWRNMVGQMGPGLAADGNGDGEVDAADYDIWKQHYGETAAGTGMGGLGATEPVPEPSGLVLVFAGAVSTLARLFTRI